MNRRIQGGGSGKVQSRARRRTPGTVHTAPVAVFIVRRETKSGPRWHVRYQHKRERAVHLGSYDTERRAKARKAWAEAITDRGGRPSREPEAQQGEQAGTLADAGQAWLETRHDLAPVTYNTYARMVSEWPAELAAKNPRDITHSDVQAWLTFQARRLQRGTLDRERGVLRMVLDYADVPANAARDRRVKLPRAKRKTYRIPSRADLAKLHAAMPTRVPLFVLLEHTGLRIHEADALRWRDIDHKRNRLLVADSKTSAGTRWVTRLEDAPAFPVKPDEADPDGFVFRDPKPSSLTNVMRDAWRDGKAPLYSAHDFRHLHASRLLHDGVLSPAQIAARLGHAHAGITLGVYSHVVPPDD